MAGQPALFGIAGADAATRHDLLYALVRAAAARTVGVSALIETEAGYDIDLPGKDSFEHRRAGAREVVMASARRWAKMHERAASQTPPAQPTAEDGGTAEARLRRAVAAMGPADLILVEGFEAAGHPRLRIHGPRVVSDYRGSAGGEETSFALDDIEGMLGLIARTCGIVQRWREMRRCEPAEV